MTGKKSMQQFTINYLSKYKSQFFWLFFATAISNILSLIPLYYMGEIINFVIMKDFYSIIRIIFMLLVIFIVSSIFSILETYLSGLLISTIIKKIKEDIYKKAQELGMEEINRLGKGKIISLIDNDSEIISNFFVVRIIQIVIAIITLIVSSIFLIWLSPLLTIIAVISFPLNYTGYIFFGKKIKIYSEKQRQTSDKYFSFLNHYLNEVMEIKAYLLEKKFQASFEKYIFKIKDYAMKLVVYEMIIGFIGQAISSFAEWGIIAMGTWMIIEGSLLIGSYVSFNSFLGRFFFSINQLLQTQIHFQTMNVSLNRLYQVLNLPAENNQRVLSLLNNHDVCINFRNVSFCYPDSKREILSNVNLQFPAKSFSVIVGLNGSGKSTLFYLLEQYYTPTKGQIFFNDQDILFIKTDSLRAELNFVQQKPSLFPGTLKDNLTMGEKQISDDEIIEACKKARLENFIKRLPKGIESEIEAVSGGQLQKISLVRALLKSGSVLLLDEVTSDLDGESEKDIMQILHSISEEKTVILVSHRPSSIISVPNIIVMDNGRIIAKGKHSQLIHSCQLYPLLISHPKGE